MAGEGVIELDVRPPYSIALICAEEYVPPKTFGGAPVAWTDTCVAFGTRSEADGSTRITLSDAIPEKGFVRVFDGVLATPDRVVRIVNAQDEVLWRGRVSQSTTPLQIWFDDEVEPDHVLITIDLDRTRGIA